MIDRDVLNHIQQGQDRDKILELKKEITSMLDHLKIKNTELEKEKKEKYELQKRCEEAEELIWNYYFLKEGSEEAITEHIKKNIEK